jgi:tRNA(Arg) A34 adenosine deaminase TadA
LAKLNNNIMNLKQQKILNKAIEIASLLEGNKFKFCAIITDRKNNILSIGLNSFVKTSPLQKKYAEKFGQDDKIYNHSEVSAINKLPYGCVPYNIYVARVSKKNQPLLGKPCIICQEAIKDVGIKNIYYTE